MLRDELARRFFAAAGLRRAKAHVQGDQDPPGRSRLALGRRRMPGGTGESGPVAATSTRLMAWLPNLSVRASHS